MSQQVREKSSRGFTIIELLVVTAIIILLLSILIVAVNAATRTSQKARTGALLSTIKKGMIRFKEDIGYYPPVLGPGTGVTPGPGNLPLQQKLWPPPNPPSLATFQTQIQSWYSTTSIADYLVGYGHHWQDGYGYASSADTLHDWKDEAPPLGIRHSGVDGAWNATLPPGDGGLCYRMGGGGGCDPNNDYGRSEGSAIEIDKGEVFGPYLELSDERLLGCITDVYPGGSPVVAFPGDAGYVADNPHVVCDYWGEAIRYYRRPYPAGALNQSYRAIDRDGDGVIEAQEAVPTLSDFYFLRPFYIKPGAEVTARFADAAGDDATTSELESAEIALFSLGPDRKHNASMRIDDPENTANTYGTDFANQDNLLEVGP
jgi:type II secretory pathway pseudopilin PulG